MRNARRAAFAALAALLLVLPAAAQSYENDLSIDSVDPVADAEIISRMRARMDTIHRQQRRPTVGLVLSGGGAKGSAHVGVLRYLEELEIPVDLICGTSMGGLVGGLAAMGYSPAFMDSLLRNQDWSITLTDKIDRSYYSFAAKKYRETYNVSIPFHYSKKDFQTRIDDQVRYGGDNARRPFGTNDFMSSLPSGYYYGFNVNNLISSLSVGYQDDINFDTLPIPYFCVAADMVSCKAKNWSSGYLKAAMRSTMSIPGMFKPVRYNGMILVDGGTRNNFPVDLARAMGCDIVIGVDLSDEDLSYSQVNNLVDILMQFITMLGKTTFDRNVGETDVFIKPDLKGYNMLSFEPVAIDTMIHRGYVAAEERADELNEIKELMNDAKPYLSAPPAKDINTTPALISSIVFNGLTHTESKLLKRKIGLKEGETVDRKEMDRIMSVIEATGCFSSVTYSILGHEAPYTLEFNCEKGPMHQFGAGVRFDNEEWPAFLFNVGLNAHRLSGFKLDFDARIGQNQRASARAALDLSWMPTVNAEAQIYNISSTLFTDLNKVGSLARYWGHTERVYLSNIRWTKIDFQLGAQHRYYRLPWQTSYGFDINAKYRPLAEGTYMGLYARGTIFTQDKFHYPSKGINLTFGYDFDPIKKDCPTFTPLHTGYFNFNSVIPFGPFALVPDLHLRAVLGSPEMSLNYDQQDPGYSIAHQNFVGGFLADRCVEGQIPFIGFGHVYKARPYVAVLNLGLRVQAAPRLFFTATGGYMRESDTLLGMAETILPTLWGAGIEGAYNTVAGPLKVIVSWSDRYHVINQDLGLYVSFGFDF